MKYIHFFTVENPITLIERKNSFLFYIIGSWLVCLSKGAGRGARVVAGRPGAGPGGPQDVHIL